jgi:hypothetical protein
MRKTQNYKKKYTSKNKTSRKRVNKTRMQKRYTAGNNSTPVVIGKIYAEWCGHCRNLKEPWKNMKMDLAKKGGYFKFHEIEQKEENEKVSNINETYLQNSPTKLSLQGGYPTIFKIKNGVLSYFDGERTSKNMADWCKK